MKEDTQKLLGEANWGVPEWNPSDAELQRMHNLSAELETYTEGRIWPNRTNFKND